MSRKQWLLVQLLDDRNNVFPSYAVVDTDSLLGEKNDIHPGKMTFVRAKHGNSARQAQILRISDDKRHVKEHKLLLERQDHQVQNMISLCMRTIKEIKTDPLSYDNTFNSSQLINKGASGSGLIPQKLDHSDSSSDSEEEITNETQNLQITKPPPKTLAQLKRVPDHYNSERVESPVHCHNQHRRSVMSSTPLPAKHNGKGIPKLTFDQATQTDPVPPQVPVEKIEQMEAVLSLLYRQFLTLVGRLQLDCQDYSTYNSDEQNETATTPDRVNQLYEQAVEENRGQSLHCSAVEAQNQYSPSPKTLHVRRVSAHTTNTVEQSYPVNEMVPIGIGNAVVPARLMNEINWNSYSSATRLLLQAIFPRKVLATHSLTGKKSPAFADKPAKKCLDPKLIDDIVDTVSARCGVPKRTVRNCITIKCTDEAKLYRNRMQGRPSNMEAAPENQENMPPSPVTSRDHVSSNESG